MYWRRIVPPGGPSNNIMTKPTAPGCLISRRRCFVRFISVVRIGTELWMKPWMADCIFSPSSPVEMIILTQSDAGAFWSMERISARIIGRIISR